jgi:hypothetical protein
MRTATHPIQTTIQHLHNSIASTAANIFKTEALHQQQQERKTTTSHSLQSNADLASHNLPTQLYTSYNRQQLHYISNNKRLNSKILTTHCGKNLGKSAKTETNKQKLGKTIPTATGINSLTS